MHGTLSRSQDTGQHAREDRLSNGLVTAAPQQQTYSAGGCQTATRGREVRRRRTSNTHTHTPLVRSSIDGSFAREFFHARPTQ